MARTRAAPMYTSGRRKLPSAPGLLTSQKLIHVYVDIGTKACSRSSFRIVHGAIVPNEATTNAAVKTRAALRLPVVRKIRTPIGIGSNHTWGRTSDEYPRSTPAPSSKRQDRL